MGTGYWVSETVPGMSEERKTKEVGAREKRGERLGGERGRIRARLPDRYPRSSWSGKRGQRDPRRGGGSGT